MRLHSFEAIITALNRANVRYLVAGGLAVNAHGYLRYTKDADLVIELVPENILAALQALKDLDYRPTIPVRAEDFADRKTRERWARDKGMKVFQLFSDTHPETPIDIFVEHPFDFPQEYDRALTETLIPGVKAPFTALDTLITMKEAVGRPRDLDDVEHLRILRDQSAEEE
ncbi:DUF6036 family nucleotidyltransferase [Natronospira bacteriovora]|uniref:DUF6036 domain-containing protein n=1 Tax=Natronospira bacteriovora TaxID=3069753 RepID=A0ABU0W628_9GAMM|nr:DUF6036 family nucleotidyltransferase [Natronospira sp. AB-CW4]MDQ2069383.1 hypothetical protein [Natronospira sp. AB-CW4]